jgi:hypothetical protein
MQSSLKVKDGAYNYHWGVTVRIFKFMYVIFKTCYHLKENTLLINKEINPFMVYRHVTKQHINTLCGQKVRPQRTPCLSTYHVVYQKCRPVYAAPALSPSAQPVLRDATDTHRGELNYWPALLNPPPPSRHYTCLTRRDARRLPTNRWYHWPNRPTTCL